MTEEAKRCVEALRDNINNGFLLVGGFNGSVHASEIIHLIESLSAQLEQVTRERHGRWEDIKGAIRCSECQEKPFL